MAWSPGLCGEHHQKELCGWGHADVTDIVEEVHWSIKKKKIHVLKWRLHGDQAVKGRVVAGGQWAVHQPVREGGGLGERGSPSETRWREVSRSEGGAH